MAVTVVALSIPVSTTNRHIAIEIASEQLHLDGSGAVYWPEREIVLLSDLHLGKVSHFRKFGAAVPRKALFGNFSKLDELMGRYRPKGVYFLGDLFHSNLNNEWELFRSWVLKWQSSLPGTSWMLVIGNHDIISDWKFEHLGMQVSPRAELGPFLLTHHPEEPGELFNVCGHIHPAVRIREYGRSTLRIPCFHRNGKRLVLPAFGAFTGTHVIRPRPGEECYLLADGEVFAWREE